MSDDEYVEVRDEPRHQHRFENEWARVYDVFVPPGDRTLFHRHTEDTLYVSVLAATIRDQTLGAEASPEMPIPAGIAVCRPHRSEPLIHRVGNHGEGPMRMIGAEVKASPPTVGQTALDSPHHELRFETSRLRAYALELAPGESSGDVAYGFSSLLIGVSLASVEVREGGGPRRTQVFEPGHISWQDGPRSVRWTNVGETPWSAILGEWR